MKIKRITALLLGAVVVSSLQGCFPIIAAGVAGGVMTAVDRRSVGTQTEDESIEWKASARVTEKLGDKAHLNFTSFNRKLLITGEVPSEDAKSEAEHIASNVNNIQGVYNELIVGPASSYSNRSNDSYITTKVKSRSVDSAKFNPVHVKVVTEAGTVFLLGMLTQTEADAAVNVARTTSGVGKVVNLIEIITPARARELDAAQRSDAKPAEAKNP